MTAEKLAAEFGIRGALDFVGVGDLVKAVVSLDGMQGELFLQGATVTRWQPAGERPVIFTSPNAIFAPGTAVRGGIPIIFPWFGPKRDEPKAPQHGFVRAAPCQLERAETSRPVEVTLRRSMEPGNVADTEVRLADGGEHRLSTRIAVDAIKCAAGGICDCRARAGRRRARPSGARPVAGRAVAWAAHAAGRLGRELRPRRPAYRRTVRRRAADRRALRQRHPDPRRRAAARRQACRAAGRGLGRGRL